MTFLSKSVGQLDEERWFGPDLAKRETQLSVLDSAGSQVQQKRFATSRSEFLSLAAELREDAASMLRMMAPINLYAPPVKIIP